MLHLGRLLPPVSPYRDSVEALLARERELDGEIAAAQAERAGVRFDRRVAWLKWLAATAVVVAATTFWVKRTPLRLMPTPDTTLAWQARVIGGSLLKQGTRCDVELRSGCQATVRCGSFGYRGQGRCDVGRYVDEGAPLADIDLRSGRVLLRQISHDNVQRTRESWSLELARE